VNVIISDCGKSTTHASFAPHHFDRNVYRKKDSSVDRSFAGQWVAVFVRHSAFAGFHRKTERDSGSWPGPPL
jgi:hypothetical protein